MVVVVEEPIKRVYGWLKNQPGATSTYKCHPFIGVRSGMQLPQCKAKIMSKITSVTDQYKVRNMVVTNFYMPNLALG